LEALSTSEYNLCLNGQIELSDAAAEILSQYSREFLDLGDVNCEIYFIFIGEGYSQKNKKVFV